MTHVPEKFVKAKIFVSLLIGSKQNGTVEFTVREWQKDFSGAAGLDDGRLRIVSKRHQQLQIFLKIVAKNSGNRMQDVLLRCGQPAVTGSGHETSGMNQVVSTRLFLQELKNLFRYFPVSLNATDVSVSRGIDDGDGVRNGHSFLVVDGVSRHGAGLNVRLILGAELVFSDALEAKRILRLDSEDVVDHPVD